MRYVFDYVNFDDDNDYLVVNGDSYETALNHFRLAVPDFKLILHVYKELF